jgi:hypothetical protein
MATGQEEEIKGEIAGANPQRRAKTGHCRLRKKKNEKDAEETVADEESQGRERSGTGSDASIPEIVVGGENEKSAVKDLEKGSERV